MFFFFDKFTLLLSLDEVNSREGKKKIEQLEV